MSRAEKIYILSSYYVGCVCCSEARMFQLDRDSASRWQRPSRHVTVRTTMHAVPRPDGGL